MPTITFNVNGENRSIDIDPSTPLLWALRELAVDVGRDVESHLELRLSRFVWICSVCTK